MISHCILFSYLRSKQGRLKDMAEGEWPDLIDLEKFPDNIINGLTLDHIVEINGTSDESQHRNLPLPQGLRI